MRKRFWILIVLPVSLIFLSACASPGVDSTFSIIFIDVGQGDAALVECDGQYMLIDGGTASAGRKVYSVLQENGVQHLRILAISHLHADHIGGLSQAVKYASDIDLAISNSTYSDLKDFENLEKQLNINGTALTVPNIGDKYNLGSAEVEVIDVSNSEKNDSLVLMVRYGKTSFMFTGDIEANAEKRISGMFNYGTEQDLTLMKLPHHGAYTSALYTFLQTFRPENIIISVGEGNTYKHPDAKTLDLFDSKTYKPRVYRTDLNGDIIVKSNGNEITVQTSK